MHANEMQTCTWHRSEPYTAPHIPERAFQRGRRVPGGSRLSLSLLRPHLKNAPTTFPRCSWAPKFILHTEHCTTGQRSGTSSHSSQTKDIHRCCPLCSELLFPGNSLGVGPLRAGRWAAPCGRGDHSSSRSPEHLGSPTSFFSYFDYRLKNSIKCGSILATWYSFVWEIFPCSL